MVIDYKLIGERIKKARKAKYLTQERVAEFLDISVSYTSRIERGVVKVSLETLVKIATLLKVAPSYLIDGTAIEEACYLSNELTEITKDFTSNKMKLLTNIAKSIDEF